MEDRFHSLLELSYGAYLLKNRRTASNFDRVQIEDKSNYFYSLSENVESRSNPLPRTMLLMWLSKVKMTQLEYKHSTLWGKELDE